MNQEIILFQGKKIRRAEETGETYYSIVDIIEVLTDSKDPSDYWTTVKRREPQLPSICRKFKFRAPDGKMRPTDCANTEGVFRIIMSIPSPKAETFKLWLAQLGKEHIEDLENPELGFARLTEIYKAKGYTDEWIEYRLKTVGIRKELTEEWQKRGVKEGQEYAILTASIAKETFGLTPTEHRSLKSLDKENLRDHMSNLELLFTALGEEFARNYSITDDAQGFSENQDTATRGGLLAGDMRRNAEKKGMKVVSTSNFLDKEKTDTPTLPPSSD